MGEMGFPREVRLKEDRREVASMNSFSWSTLSDCAGTHRLQKSVINDYNDLGCEG